MPVQRRGAGLVRAVLARVDASARAQWCAIFVPAAVLYLLTMHTDPWTMSADPVAVTPSAWSLAHTGSPVLSVRNWPFINPWQVAVDPGHVVSNRTPGLIYLATPFYWLFGRADSWDVLPASLEAALITAAALACFGLLIRRLAGPRVALAAAFVAGTATTTWAVSGIQLYPHGPDQLLLVLAMLCLAGAPTTRRSLGAGLAFAAAILIRPPLAVVAAISGLARSPSARRWHPALLIGALSAASLAGYLLYSHHYWSAQRGALNSTATHNYGTTITDWSPAAIGDYLVRITGALVSPGKGVFIGAPFLVLLLPGLRTAWRSAPGWARAAAISGSAYLLIQLKVEIFSGGQYFWSYRYPLETLTLCAPLLVLSWQSWTARTAVRRGWFAGLVSLAVGMQAVGAICFHGPFPDRPWTFDNLGAALSGSLAAPAIMLLVLSVLVAAGLVRRGYAPRRCSTSPAPIAVVPEPVSTTSRPVSSIATAVPVTARPVSAVTDTD